MSSLAERVMSTEVQAWVKKNDIYTMSSSSLLSTIVSSKLLNHSQWCPGETQPYPLKGGCGGVRHC